MAIDKADDKICMVGNAIEAAMLGAISAIIIPVIIIVTMNIMIIRAMYQKQRNILLPTQAVQKSERTCLLILAQTVLFGLTQYLSIGFIILNIFVDVKTEVGSAVLYLALRVFQTMVLVNAAGNFWVYAVSGSRFRQDLKQILKWFCSCRFARNN